MEIFEVYSYIEIGATVMRLYPDPEDETKYWYKVEYYNEREGSDTYFARQRRVDDNTIEFSYYDTYLSGDADAQVAQIKLDQAWDPE